MGTKTPNLSEKAIWDFKSGDTIYMSVKMKGHENPMMFYCEFIMLVHNTVYGKVLSVDVNEEQWKHTIEKGLEVHCDFKKCSLFGQGVNETHTYHHWFNTMGYAYKELAYEETEKTITHPSFGMVGLSRRSSSGVVPLFASNIQHQHTVTLTIKRAEHNRHLNNDWIHGKEQLIEVELSGSQFAELITSFNMGDGVPCTIRQFNRQSYPDPPYENPVDIFQREFAAEMKNLSVDCKSVVEDSVKMLKEKATIGKGDREFLMKAMESLVTQINSKMPFISQQFNESMEKTVSQAKNEIETFVTNKIYSLGLDQAKANAALFVEGMPSVNPTPDAIQITGKKEEE
jgi:hypothetical protein